MSTCLDLVKREIKDLTEQELDQVLAEMRDRQAQIIADGGDPTTAAAQAGRQVADAMRAATAIEKRNAAINFKVRTEALDYLRTTWQDDPVEGIFALLYGSPKSRFGSRASVNAAQDAHFRKYMAGVEGDLTRSGLFDVLRRGEMDRDVAKAMWSIGDKDELAKLPKQAVEIAQTLHKWQEVAREDGNRHGGWIGKLDNYVVRQSHSPDRMIAAGEKAWKDAILPRLDMAKTFPDGVPKDLGDWFHETFTNLTTGVRPKSGDASAERMSAFKGPGNLAKKMSQERTLHFKGADDWFDYNEKFGFGNLRESFVTGLHRAAESNGLLQVLGTNPRYNVDAIVKAVRTRLSRAEPKLLQEFDRRTRSGRRIENAIREVSGETRRVASQRMATVGSAIRTWNSLTGLGGAVLSAITDIPIRAAALRHQGQGYFKSLADGVIAPLGRIAELAGKENPVERRAVLSASGYFNEIAMGNLASRFSPDESMPGRLQRATHTFFKWNLLGGWTDTMRRSSFEAMGRFFGEVAESDFGKLSARTQRTLEKFRIGEAEWNVIRKGITDADDNKFLTPQAVREMPPAEFAGLAADRINALKVGLAERVTKRMTQDAKERAWVDQRAVKLREGLASARAGLEKRLKASEGAATKEITALQGKLSNLEESIDFATSYWESPRGDTPGISGREDVGFYGKSFLRDLGVKEGEAREAMKRLAADARQVGNDLDRLRKGMHEEFIERWSDRQDDLVAFADGVDQRIRTRAEINARELGNLEPQVKRILEDTRESAADKIQQLYADEVDSAVISPDARTLAFMRQGSEAGTPVGEALRLFWQFKSFGIAIMQRAFMREFYGYGKGAGGKLGMSEMQGLATLMAGSVAFGYAAMSAKDLLKGKTPRPLDDPKTYAAAMAQGGAMGIYGDFLFGQTSRFGGGFLETLGGPTAGKVSDAFRLFQELKSGDAKAANAFKFALQNTPYANLFYTRMAVDYFFLYELQESMNPGYLRRMERRAEQENGQEWWLRPSEVVN
jgi:hypothetical protein